MVRPSEAYQSLMKAALRWNHEGWSWSGSGGRGGQNGGVGTLSVDKSGHGDRIRLPIDLRDTGRRDDAGSTLG